MVDCTGLEIRRTVMPYRGFESHPLRQTEKKRALCPFFCLIWVVSNIIPEMREDGVSTHWHICAGGDDKWVTSFVGDGHIKTWLDVKTLYFVITASQDAKITFIVSHKQFTTLPNQQSPEIFHDQLPRIQN